MSRHGCIPKITGEVRMSDVEINSAVPHTAASLRAHYRKVVLPIWRGPGFNSTLRLAYEAVAGDATNALAPAPPARYRAMACARQMFVFSLAGGVDDIAHADMLFDSLIAYFRDNENGGWFYSVDANGAPKEKQKDLYTHAFVIFACAEYAKHASPERAQQALAVLEETSSLIEARMVHGDLLASVMSENFCDVLATPAQNPLMHLTEAWLAARETTSDSVFDRRLEQLAAAVMRTFVHRETGFMAELPLGSDHNWLEPGHQFEWMYLAESSRHPAFETVGLTRALIQAFDFARRFGVDQQTGGVAASLDEHGQVIDSTQRIWAQSEYLRALAHHVDADVRAELPAQIARFGQRFILPHGWIEAQSASGDIVRAEMPSTTPYHLATAYAALP
jgi:mannose/cellobiose epimerase-like protein (N-acyl-D-glucosamine 2-epimerase family)